MQPTPEEPIGSVTLDECWELLGTSELGRLAVSVRDVLDIYPVNYIVDGRSVVFRTTEGTKLLEITINNQVVFEADGWDDTQAWSVVVHGTARALDRETDILRADTLPLHQWLPTAKSVYIRITPQSVTGRRILRGEEPGHFPI